MNLVPYSANEASKCKGAPQMIPTGKKIKRNISKEARTHNNI
jgi:hypothetical protein